jgi:hypothetical protein
LKHLFIDQTQPVASTEAPESRTSDLPIAEDVAVGTPQASALAPQVARRQPAHPFEFDESDGEEQPKEDGKPSQPKAPNSKVRLACVFYPSLNTVTGTFQAQTCPGATFYVLPLIHISTALFSTEQPISLHIISDALFLMPTQDSAATGDAAISQTHDAEVLCW